MKSTYLREGISMTTKAKLHQRNQHLDGYDFARLLKDSPELKEFTTLNPVGKTTGNMVWLS